MRSISILDAGRICNGRNRFYQSKELRKYYYEKPYGLLYWNRNVVHHRSIFNASGSRRKSDILGILGTPGFGVFTDYANFSYSGFVFNLVFCATTATIVSGAMAERTKFITYCIYSAVISGIIYPIEAHWTWGNGFLVNMGFHDFAGSNCIHMVGGICALIGAAMLGPRIGKFSKDKDGKITKVNAIRDTTWLSVPLVYLSSGLAGMDSMVQQLPMFRHWDLSF